MRIGLVVVVCGLVGLAGCSGGVLGGVPGGVASPGTRVTGAVHGGQQPIVGAHVYLFAASTTGYGGAGIAASSSNASVSLLTSAGNTALDSSGGATNGDYYVTTDASGGFSITGDYTCATGAQVYLYTLGGNPGSGVNSAAGLMAVLGSCPAAGNFAAATPFVMVNEVSTIAAAYAMAGFATDATHVGSSGTALALTGIANAFANAGNLVDLPTGAALATTPAGNGTVPQAEINTLANVLASCVNSNGVGSTACSTLFANAMSGGSSGTVAGDTAAAAINVAHNPGVNVAMLYGLQTATSPFAVKLTSSPLDFSVGINFTGGGIYAPLAVAVDGSGNVWIVNKAGGVSNNGTVSKLSSAGTALSPASGFAGGGLNYPHSPTSIAIDKFGNVWVGTNSGGVSSPLVKFSNVGVALSPSTGYTGGGLLGTNTIAIDASGNAWAFSGDSLAKFSNTGIPVSPSTGYTGGGLNNPISIAIDGAGNVWTANEYLSTVSEFSNAGAAISPSTGYANGPYEPTAIAIDGGGNVWVTAGGSLSKFSNSGNALSPQFGYTGGGLFQTAAIAIDGAGEAWIGVETDSTISHFSSVGVPITSSFGYRGGGLNGPVGIAIDGSGNAWTANNGGVFGSVTQMIGVAAPVITPISAGLPATPTADGSSMLGTRP
jgi:hypothetical protein